MRIVYFQQQLLNLNNIEYKTYSEITNNLGLDKIIYSDRASCVIPRDIALFHTYYLRNFFHKKIIITTIKDLDYLYDNKAILSSSYVIVIYDRKNTRIEKTKNDDMYFCDMDTQSAINIIKGIIQ